MYIFHAMIAYHYMTLATCIDANLVSEISITLELEMLAISDCNVYNQFNISACYDCIMLATCMDCNLVSGILITPKLEMLTILGPIYTTNLLHCQVGILPLVHYTLTFVGIYANDLFSDDGCIRNSTYYRGWRNSTLY